MKPVIFLFSLVASCLAAGCPDNAYIHPCTCRDLFNGMNVYCENIDSMKDLENALSNLRKENILIGEMHLTNINLGRFPSTLFKGLRVSTLRHTNSDLLFESNRAFQGLENSLKELYISKYKISKSDLESISFAHLRNLDKLSVSSLDLDNLRHQKWPHSVSQFLVTKGAVQSIESGAFSNLDHLEEFLFINNQIHTISRDVLPRKIDHLKKIDFSNNKIEHIDPDFFEGMDSLQEIQMSHNSLTTLEETTWKPVWKDNIEIKLQVNPIVCNSSLAWIVKTGIYNKVHGKCNSPPEYFNMELHHFVKNILLKEDRTSPTPYPYRVRTSRVK